MHRVETENTKLSTGVFFERQVKTTFALLNMYTGKMTISFQVKENSKRGCDSWNRNYYIRTRVNLFVAP